LKIRHISANTSSSKWTIVQRSGDPKRQRLSGRGDVEVRLAVAINLSNAN